MSCKYFYPEWDDIINNYFTLGRQIAIAVFSEQFELLYYNSSMAFFLNIDNENQVPGNSFVNPDLKDFLKKEDGKLFEGLLTIGNFKDISYVLQAEILKREQKTLLIAEVDIPELFSENKKMSRLNQEVNNLQRQLLKEKRSLQATLSELKETQEMLIHSEKMSALGKLVAGVAHEINNPIAFVYSNFFSLETNINDIIDSYAEVEGLIAGNKDQELSLLVQELRNKNEVDFSIEDIRDIIQESKVGIERVKVIVEDLRKFSRLDESEIKNIELIENINSTLSFVKAEIDKKLINFTFVSPEKLSLECYPGQLNQALLNILVNAIQAVSEKGNIWLTVTDEAENVTISIKDDGQGIPDEIKEKIYEPFFTTKEVGSGTGLGLSITHKIIRDLHKGKITLESELGKGSNFIISIPKI